MGHDIIGKNVRHYPTEGMPFDPSPVTVVLVAGSIGDYAAYAGIGSPEFVARLGDKISFEEAGVHFPGIEDERYRR